MQVVSADSFFIIGKNHDVCEDYAASGTVGNISYALIADGCSTGVHTDIGSRLIVRSAIPFVTTSWMGKCLHEFGAKVFQQAKKAASLIGLNDESLAATLLGVRSDGDKFNAFVFGDGCVFARKRDGSLIIHQHEFPSGAPFYFVYNTNEQNIKDYLATFDGDMEITDYVIDPDGNVTSSLRKLPFHRAHVVYEYDSKYFDYVGVVSDGASSFLDSSPEKEDVDIVDIIYELAAFKNFKGKFVERRMKKSCTTFQKNGWNNYDDLSIGVVYSGWSDSDGKTLPVLKARELDIQKPEIVSKSTESVRGKSYNYEYDETIARHKKKKSDESGSYLFPSELAEKLTDQEIWDRLGHTGKDEPSTIKGNSVPGQFASKGEDRSLVRKKEREARRKALQESRKEQLREEHEKWMEVNYFDDGDEGEEKLL